MSDKPRSAFLESADLPALSRWGRWLRLQFRDAPAAPAPAQAAGDERSFAPNEEGSGVFGKWTLDGAGLPAYRYEADQYLDPRAAYPNTEQLDRRDHWHQVGNQRITALASNDGTVQVYIADRGGVFLNRFEAYRKPGFNLLVFLASLAIRAIQFLARMSRLRAILPAPFSSQAQALAEVEKQAATGEFTPRSSPSLEALDMIAQTGSPDGSPAAQTITPPSQRLQQAANIQRDPAATRHAYAGGFGYMDDGAATWATAFCYRPTGARTRRLFGIGYTETRMTYRNIRVTRRVYAPYGDVPALLVDVQIENLGKAAANLKHYEYWDVNVQQLKLEWLRSAAFAPASDEARRALNRHFAISMRWRQDRAALFCEQKVKEPPPGDFRAPEEACDTDWSPARIFLADLNEGNPDAYYYNRNAFFGAGGAEQPDMVLGRRAGDPASAQGGDDPMPFCMVLRRDIHIEAGESRTLRFAYGAIGAEETLKFLEDYRQGDAFNDMRKRWKDDLAYFYTGEDPVLQREMAWHTYNLLSATVYSAYHKTHVVPQGSAYLYLHGADGAPRDQALFAIPMTYLKPTLARDLLRIIMRLTNGQTGQITYAFAGHGFISNAMNVHNKPSDLDLFFLLAMSEYLAATGDMAFLDEDVPYYPPGKPHNAPGTTILDHIRFALKHLFEGVGVGDHGLIKVGSGDWSDSIVLETALRDGIGPFGVTYQNSKDHGESVPNTQMALYALPLLAAILKMRAPDVGEMIAARLAGLSEAASKQWNPAGWYNRAVLRNIQNAPVVIRRHDLEAQTWALISGAAREDGTEANLIEQADAALDGPSKIGATLVPRGMVWPAVSQLLTWGYARAGRGALAWRSLNRNTFAAHAVEYPAVWFGIWSGPDGVHGVDAREPDVPGGSWSSPMTPMSDFPVMNANPDAMALLGLLRVCGIEPAPEGDGLVVKPLVPRDRFVLDMPLLRVVVEPHKISGVYRAANAGTRVLYVYPPGATTPRTVTLAFAAGEMVAWDVLY